jgi:hypothetical protein
MQAVKIECAKQPELSCLEATASRVGNEPEIEVAHYDVIHRDDSGLIAQDDSPECATHKLVVNFQEQSVLAIDSSKQGPKSCISFPTQIFKLVKG